MACDTILELISFCGVFLTRRYQILSCYDLEEKEAMVHIHCILFILS